MDKYIGANKFSLVYFFIALISKNLNTKIILHESIENCNFVLYFDKGFAKIKKIYNLKNRIKIKATYLYQVYRMLYRNQFKI